MNLLLLTDLSWRYYPAAAMILIGGLIFWRALRGGPDGERGLARRHTEIVERVEGFRLAMLGLVLAGLGAAWIWQMPWLLFLALGIGFVEIRESTAIITAIKQGERGDRQRSGPNGSTGRRATRPARTPIAPTAPRRPCSSAPAGPPPTAAS